MYNNYNRFGYAQYTQQPAYQQQQPMYQQPMNTQDMPIQAIRFMNEAEALINTLDNLVEIIMVI